MKGLYDIFQEVLGVGRCLHCPIEWRVLPGKYQWTVNNLAKQLSCKGKYVMLGATRKTCDAHKSLFKTVARADDDEKMAVWGSQKQIRMDHAIGVTVESDWQGTIYDNGCKPTGQKVLSPQNLAGRHP